MTDRRIVITGLGAVTPLGVGMDETWAGLNEPRAGVKTIDLFAPGEFRCKNAGQIDDFSARKFVPKSYRKAVKVMARDIEIAVAAADLAVRDAGLVTAGTAENDDDPPTVPAKRFGCNIGAGLICAELDELGQAVNTSLTGGTFDLKTWGTQGMTNLTPLWLLKYLPNMLSCHVTIIHDARGPSNCITCGDASAHLSVCESAMYIQRNVADVVIAGAAESKLNPMGLLRQELLGRLCNSGNDTPASAIRPFDTDHAGLAIGEGGALLILEELEHAKARSAKIYAELVGCGAACDPAATDVERPTAGNLHLATRTAMQTAGLGSEEIDALVAYGTAVPGEDRTETDAWTQALGDRAGQIPAISFTGSTGSMFAGHGAVQLAVAARMLADQAVPPTANFQAPAEGCSLNLADAPRQAEINTVLTGAYTVGGQSGACILKRYAE